MRNSKGSNEEPIYNMKLEQTISQKLVLILLNYTVCGDIRTVAFEAVCLA
jgi:hypothetical protein